MHDTPSLIVPSAIFLFAEERPVMAVTSKELTKIFIEPAKDCTTGLILKGKKTKKKKKKKGRKRTGTKRDKDRQVSRQARMQKHKLKRACNSV